MEATGGYESLLVKLLHQRKIALAVVNPRQVRDCCRKHEKRLKAIEEQIETVVQADEPNARKVEILNSVKGVGPVTVSTIKTFYQRLLAKGKPKKVALTAAMRKLLTILNALVKLNPLWRVPKLCPVK